MTVVAIVLPDVDADAKAAGMNREQAMRNDHLRRAPHHATTRTRPGVEHRLVRRSGLSS